jgi:hypothetical protein
MRIRGELLLLLLIAIGLLGAANGVRRLRQERAGTQAANALLAATRTKALEVESLRGLQARVATRQRPAQDVIAQVNAILADAGLGTDAFKALVADTDAPVDGLAGRTGYRHQSLSLSLEDLRPIEVGRFLDELRRRQKVWIPSRLELFHRRTPRLAADGYDVQMLLTATYLSDEMPESR